MDARKESAGKEINALFYSFRMRKGEYRGREFEPVG
jgi:hypothetical protein